MVQYCTLVSSDLDPLLLYPGHINQYTTLVARVLCTKEQILLCDKSKISLPDAILVIAGMQNTQSPCCNNCYSTRCKSKTQRQVQVAAEQAVLSCTVSHLLLSIYMQ